MTKKLTPKESALLMVHLDSYRDFIKRLTPKGCNEIECQDCILRADNTCRDSNYFDIHYIAYVNNGKTLKRK